MILFIVIIININVNNNLLLLLVVVVFLFLLNTNLFRDFLVTLVTFYVGCKLSKARQTGVIKRKAPCRVKI